jgi:NADPH:quinone reductase
VKAVIATEKGAELRDLPKPAPAPNEILIRARASSLNRADLLAAIRGGGARLGLECAGEVEAVGAEVKGFKPVTACLPPRPADLPNMSPPMPGARTASRPTT